MNIGIIGLLVFIALELASIGNMLGKILEQSDKEKTGSNELQGAQRKPRRRYHHFEDTMV